ncbi:BrxA/BrxB family bacilliredoxin [Spirosoma luteolum]
MYPPHLLVPMREDLTSVGFQELTSAADVDAAMTDQKGTTLVVVNSVCGCAAGAARPGVKAALAASTVKPDQLVTVFAGGDVEATARMREYLLPYPPSSPAIAIFKDGDLVHFIERHHIEGRSAQMIAQHLEMALDEFCTPANA